MDRIQLFDPVSTTVVACGGTEKRRQLGGTASSSSSMLLRRTNGPRGAVAAAAATKKTRSGLEDWPSGSVFRGVSLHLLKAHFPPKPKDGSLKFRFQPILIYI